MSSPHLLDNHAMWEFLTRGYITVQVDLPASFNRDIQRRANEIFAGQGNPGNELLPCIPQLYRVLTHPRLVGVLTSILGRGYMIHPHRHCHLNPPSSDGQKHHQDSYEDDKNVRHHHSRWAMAFYYPQDVDADMGPSSILPATQYYNTHTTVENQPELPLCGAAGTVTVVHYDLWHRATPNRSNQQRYMMKFLFCRRQDPDHPTWQYSESFDPGQGPMRPDDPPRAVCSAQWHWLSGRRHTKTEPDRSVELLLDELHHDREEIRLTAAYDLGKQGAVALPSLIKVLSQEAAERVNTNLDRNHANPSQLDVGYALVTAGAMAVPELTTLLADDAWWVRAAVADILGDIGPEAGAAVPELLPLLNDESDWVRRNAAEALGNMGSTAAPAAITLGALLHDEHSRVRHNAATALWRLGPAASPAVPALRRALNDDSYFVSRHAEFALSELMV